MAKLQNVLITQGFSIIPIWHNTKIPAVPWKNCKVKPITAPDLEYLQATLGTDKLGIVCGYNNLEVIDVDLKAIKGDLNAFWQELSVNLYEVVPNGLTVVKTQNNGFHILYQCTKLEGNLKLAKLNGCEQYVIETRGQGGYVVLHQLPGNDYTNIIEITPAERDGLMAVCRSFNQVAPVPIPTAKTKAFVGRIEGVSSWQNFNNQVPILSLLAEEFSVVNETEHWYLIKRHGAASESSGKVFKNTNTMYLHSTGTRYDSERIYTASQVYAIQNNLNTKELTIQLTKHGY